MLERVVIHTQMHANIIKSDQYLVLFTIDYNWSRRIQASNICLSCSLAEITASGP